MLCLECYDNDVPEDGFHLHCDKCMKAINCDADTEMFGDDAGLLAGMNIGNK